MKSLEERDRLIEENIALVFWMKGRLRRRLEPVKRARLISDDDIEELAEIGIVKAANRFSPERGAFSTLYSITVSHDATTLIKKREQDLLFKCLSLDLAYEAGRDGDADTSLADLLADPDALEEIESVAENVAMQELCRDIMKVVGHNRLALRILQMRQRGMTYREIGQVLGVSYQRCQQVVKKVQERAEAIKRKHGG